MGVPSPRWDTFDNVEQRTMARILFWNCVDAPRKNYSVWRAHHCYLRLVLDPEEDSLVSLRFNLDIFLGLLQVEHLC